MSEKDIERSILHYLSMLPNCFSWKEDSQGMIWDKGGERKVIKLRSRYRAEGKSDILGVYRGKFFAIEVKSGRGKPTQAQLNFIESIKRAGGHGIVVWSLDEAISFMNQIK